MRSRYSAYARGMVDYIIETTDPDGEAWKEPRAEWRKDIQRFGEEMDFLGVQILESQYDGDRGEVRFYAKLRKKGRDASFEEHSHFLRRQGKWLYVSGR